LRWALGLGAAALAGLGVPLAQQLGSLDAPTKLKGYVSYAAEPQTVAAGKRAVLELHFRVAEGFHVNSHTPKSELLIPTELTLTPDAGMEDAGKMEYPAGTEYRVATSPGERLDVYTGGFRIRLPVLARAGQHLLTGALRYQACDRAACYPPKSLPVQVLFTAK